MELHGRFQEIIVEDETVITVEEGATMVVSNNGCYFLQQPMLNLAGTANTPVDVDYLGEQGTLRIQFAEEVKFGIDTSINNQTTTNWTGHNTLTGMGVLM